MTNGDEPDIKEVPGEHTIPWAVGILMTGAGI